MKAELRRLVGELTGSQEMIGNDRNCFLAPACNPRCAGEAGVAGGLALWVLRGPWNRRGVSECASAGGRSWLTDGGNRKGRWSSRQRRRVQGSLTVGIVRRVRGRGGGGAFDGQGGLGFTTSERRLLEAPLRQHWRWRGRRERTCEPAKRRAFEFQGALESEGAFLVASAEARPNYTRERVQKWSNEHGAKPLWASRSGFLPCS